MAILLIAALLFVPVRYRLNLTGNESISADGFVRWLLRIVSFRVQYTKESSFRYSLRVFGIRIFGNRKPKSKPAEESEDANETKESTNMNPAQIDSPEQAPEKKDSTVASEKESDPITDKESNKKSNKKDSSGQQSFIHKISDKIKKIKKMYLKWKRILTDSHNQNAFSFLKKTLVEILKRCIPDQLYLHAIYSTGSPDTTAEALGIVACFPIGYQNKWKIIPDFDSENAYFRGDGYLKGKIYLYQIVCHFKTSYLVTILYSLLHSLFNNTFKIGNTI